MAMPFLNHTETPLNFQKLKKNPKKSNKNSFWAFILSIFIYLSIFYVFNLSPSTLLSTTKFWFFISNTLILIIAADFSSSKDRDVFDEYAKNSSAASSKNNTVIPSYEIVPYVNLRTMPDFRRHEGYEQPQEKIITMVDATTTAVTTTTATTAADGDDDQTQIQNIAAGAIDDDDDDQIQIQKPVQDKPVEIFPAHEKTKEKKRDRKAWKKKRARTFSAVEVEKESGAGEIVLQRTLSEKRGEEVAPAAPENEFSRMSDEELNRRVEEFIRRCNRQIRLEAAVSTR